MVRRGRKTGSSSLSCHNRHQPKQLSLFEEATASSHHQLSPQGEGLLMSVDFLLQWKQRIFNYQQHQRQSYCRQISLLSEDNCSLEEIENLDPFSLKTHTDQFYRLPQYEHSSSCIYFILDTHFPLLLYVGETKNSPRQRWTSHDCRGYINSYIRLHRQYLLPVTIRSAFYWGVSHDRKLRQAMEKSLILKWRPPFNKESWQWWGQPFVSTL